MRPLAAASAVMALALAGCTGMTYGTGKTPAMQTIEDLTGLATGAGKAKEPIDYTARPKIVAPPTITSLPPPGSDSSQPAANWPNDPDALRAKVLAEADARAASGTALDYRLPKGTTTTGAIQAQTPDHQLTPEEEAKLKKAFADARGGVSVDANGNPVRRYLTDPPTEYRLPDPNAPLEVATTPKKKKFKWWWQQ